jgi:hypothetical protein
MSLQYNVNDIWTGVNMLFANFWPLVVIPLFLMTGAITIFLLIGVFRSLFMGRIGD